MSPISNPVRLLILGIGLTPARPGFLGRECIVCVTDLSRPRIVTGSTWTPKNTVDVAIVGIVSGTVAITGVGFAGSYQGLVFALGGDIADGTIVLASQWFGVDTVGELGLAMWLSVLLTVVATPLVTTVFQSSPTKLISVLSSDQGAVELGATYLRIIGLGTPFVGLNLIGSRVFAGGDDTYTTMTLRTNGAIANIVLNAVPTFGFDLDVEGAALRTVLSNVAVTGASAIDLSRGSLPGVGAFLVAVDPFGPFLDIETMRDLVKIGIPVMGRSPVWMVMEFPMLAILDSSGLDVVAAFIIARRIWELTNTSGWDFGLASPNLVGQAPGKGDEQITEVYGNEVIRSVAATYLALAALVTIFARPIVLGFVDSPTDPAVPTAVDLIYVACITVILQSVSGDSAGPFNASDDIRWTFGSQFAGMFLGSIPLTYIGSITSPGLTGLYLAFFVEATASAVLNYCRFKTGTWKVTSRSYRPKAAVDD